MFKGHLQICICDLYVTFAYFFIVCFLSFLSQNFRVLYVFRMDDHALILMPVNHSYFKISVNLWDYFIV